MFDMSHVGDVERYRAKLTQDGYELLGAGCFSQVYGRAGDPVVIKVCKSKDKWFDYAQWILKNVPEHPNVPRIYELEDHGAWYAAKMERLERSHERVAYEPTITSAYALGMMSAMCREAYSSGWEQRRDNYLPDSLCQLVRRIRKELVEPKYLGWDIKADNCMVRHTDTLPELVLTDPVC